MARSIDARLQALEERVPAAIPETTIGRLALILALDAAGLVEATPRGPRILPGFLPDPVGYLVPYVGPYEYSAGEISPDQAQGLTEALQGGHWHRLWVSRDEHPLCYLGQLAAGWHRINDQCEAMKTNERH